jgi:molybdenum cofactor cytidylyltransferase
LLAAVILSAGESSRMGSPKALVPFRGRTFLEHLLRAVGEAQIATGGRIGLTRVVLGARAEEIRAQLGLDAASVVLNPDWKRGQLSSIQAAIRSLPRAENEQSDGIVLFLVDHPLISSHVLTKLIQSFYESGRPIVLPTFMGKRGHPVIFTRTLFGELLAADREQGARAVVWAHADEVLEVPTDEEGVVMNLNDPEALRRATERL